MTLPIVERLIAAGMSPDEAARKERLFAVALDALAPAGGTRADEIYAIWVPGRIEFLGKHTDYAGGRSILCSVERGICVVASRRRGRVLRVRDARTGEVVACELDERLEPRAGDWSNYPMTVARRVARNFPGVVGADVAFASDLPVASGMSSSSALVVAIFLAISAANALSERDEYRRYIRGAEELAGYLGTVENGLDFPGLPGDRGVGTFGGSEDHTAILCARPDAVVQYSFCPVRFERTLPLPDGFVFAIASSGVVAEKAGAALDRYNALSRRARALAALWRRETGRDEATLADALAAAARGHGPALPDLLARGLTVDGFPADELRNRLEHFVTESDEIIPAAATALARGDLPALGSLVDRSQCGAEHLLGNQIPETVVLTRDARRLGAIATSAFGAGFGGSVWALVPTPDAEAFVENWREDYLRRFPEHAARAEFFVTRAGPPATRIA